MAGIANKPTTDSVAPITPVDAANIMHIIIAPIARPPGSFLVNMWIELKSCWAIPDLSSIEPINTNKGTAAKIKLEAIPSILDINWKKTASPNVKIPKAKAIPISENATGKPRKINKNKIKISQKNIDKNLYTKGIPHPELLIRTGNTQRLSNFLLWQLSYSEIFFVKKLWPDFSKNDYVNIINKFKSIKRNFGSI